MRIRIIEEGAEQFYELRNHETIITVGRTKVCDIQLSEKRTSRKHCEIRKTDSGYSITDLQSANGTKVNGKDVVDSKLIFGDKIEIGKAIIYFGEPLPAKKIPIPSSFVKEPVIAPRKMSSRHKKQEINMDEGIFEFKMVKKLGITIGVLFVLFVIGAIVYKEANSGKSNNNVNPLHSELYLSELENKDKDRDLREFRRITNLDISLDDKFIQLGRFVGSLSQKKYYKEFYLLQQNFIDNLPHYVNKKLKSLNAKVNKQMDTNNFGAAMKECIKFKNRYDDKRYNPDVWQGGLFEIMDEVLENAEIFFDIEIVNQANVAIDSEDWQSAKNTYRSAKDEYFKEMRSMIELCNQRLEMIDRIIEAVRNGKYEELPDDFISKIRKKKHNKPIKPKVDEDPEPTPAEKNAELLNVLQKHLIRCINKVDGESIYPKVIYFEPGSSKTKKPITGCDEEFLFYTDKKKKSISWSDITPQSMIDLYRRIKHKTAEDFWGTAAFGFKFRLDIEASEVLAEFFTKNKDLKDKIYQFMAEQLEIDVPEDGFIYYKASGSKPRLITPAEHQVFLDKKELKKIMGKLKTSVSKLSRAKTPRTLDIAKAEIIEIIRRMLELGATDEKKVAVELLRKAMEKMAKRAKSGSGHLSSTKKRKLEAARAKALGRIEDKVKYPDANHGKRDANGEHGQPWVDEAVGEMKTLWEDPAYGHIDSVLARILDMYYEIVNMIDAENKYHNPDDDKEFVEEVKKQLEDDRILRDNASASAKVCTGSEKAHVRIVNQYRMMLGRRAVRINPKLTIGARRHASYLKETKKFAHVVPGHPDGAKPMDRAKKQGYRGGVGENIAMNSRGHDANSSFVAWYNSSGHHRNMVNRMWRVMGVGDAGTHWCQMFGSVEDGSEPKEKK